MDNLGEPLTVGYQLRIVLLGENEQSQLKLFKLIHDSREFKPESKISVGQKTDLLGQWRGTTLSLVRISNIFSREREHVRRLLEERVIQCQYKPNLLLLLVQPSIFTEKNRHRLMFILDLFGKEAFQRSLVVTAHGEEQTNMSLNHLLASCGGCCLYVVREDVGELVEKMQSVIKENDGFLRRNKKSLSEKKNTALNLLLCGSSGRLKTLALQALSSQKELVPVVELPALFGQSQQIVLKESLKCVSQFEPQGVHAFILVLPVGPLTDEDKQEIETLQKTFGPQLFEFALIVFSVESNPIPADVLRTNKEIQQLCERCGERADVFNLLDTNQIPELMDMVEELRCSQHPGYSLETFAHVQIKKILQLENLIGELQSSENNSTGEEDGQSPQHLRIVLLGKTGYGKSSSGNTILGKTEFSFKLCAKSVTKCCKKVPGEVDGRPVFVVDTPGLFDKSLSNEQIYDELVKCISLLAPGPHVFLLVLPIDRLSLEDEETLKLIRKWFGKGAEKFTIVLFTKGDTLEQEKKTIEQYIQDNHDSFEKLLSDCGGRFHMFNNKEKENRAQVSELIKKIDDMVRENGRKCFTNEMLQEAEAAIQKEAQRILKEKEEEMKREQQELERKYKIEIEEMKKRIEEQRTEINRERNMREKQLKVMEDNIRMQEKNNQELEKRAKEVEDMRRALEERERLALEEKVKELKTKMKIDINEKENVEKELEKVRAEQMKAQEAWERERVEREKENQQRQQEKLNELQKLADEYKQEKEKLETQAREEEERYRQEEENQRKDLEDKHKKSMQQMKETHEKNARTQAEELNESQMKHKQELKDKEKEQAKEIQRAVRSVTKTKGSIRKIRELLKRQEKEVNSKQDQESMTTLLKKHEKEITDVIRELMNETGEDWCPIM